MITPSFGLTATERVLPRLALDWTTGLAQSGVDVTRAGVATFVGSNGFIQSATADTQRIDYSTGVAGLLIEESRTNLFTQSNEFDGADWSSLNVAISGTATQSPDGTTNAYFIEGQNSGNLQHRVQHDATVVTNTVYSFSVFAKKGNITQIRMDVAHASGFADVAYFDLDSGTVVSDATFDNSAKIESFANGWYRCSINIKNTVDTLSNCYVRTAVNGSSTYNVDSYSGGVYLYGAQLEEGAFHTSYIPTTSAQVTRTADVASMTGTDFSDWFNASEGTFFVQSDGNAPIPGSTARRYMEVTENSTVTNQISIEYRTTTQARLFVNSAGASQAVISRTKTDGGFNSVVGSYKQNLFQIACNGSTLANDIAGDVPSGLNTLKIGSGFDDLAVRCVNGRISKILYWPQSLIANEIQAFSR